MRAKDVVLSKLVVVAEKLTEELDSKGEGGGNYKKR